MGVKRKRVRLVAVAAVRRADGTVLVQRGTEPQRGGEFNRLVGGGIEFGESAEEAVVREWREELDVQLHDVRLLGWLENRFVYDGRPAHEVVAVHAGRVDHPRVLGTQELPLHGTDGTAHWVPAQELLAGPRPLYPDGLPLLLQVWLGS